MAKVKINAKNMPGIIRVDSNMHDEAIVVSGALNLENINGDLNGIVALELEKAALEINELEGIVGHIKAAVTATSTDMVSVTDIKAMVKTSHLYSARITLTLIVFLVTVEDAESIARKTLAAIRKRSREVM